MDSPAGTPALMRSVSSLKGLQDGEDGGRSFDATVDQIKEQHLKAAREAIRDDELREGLLEDIEYDCERLRSFLLAGQVRPPVCMRRKPLQTRKPQILEEVSPRSKDVIVGVGEKLSCRIVAAALIDRVRIHSSAPKSAG